MKRLAISVITYNRPQYIEQGLLEIADVTRKNDIDIYIYDGSSNGDTRAVVEKFSALGYNHIFYRYDGVLSGNNDSILSAKNRERAAFTEPYAEYIWFSGDKALLESDSLERVADALKRNPDMLVFYPDYEYKEFTDPAEFFKGCAVAFSWFGAAIIKKELYNIDEALSRADITPGFAIQSGYLSAIDKDGFLGIRLTSSVLSYYGKHSDSESLGHMWKGWIDDWYSFLRNCFPKRFELIKEDVMSTYDKQTGFFSKSQLIRQRIEGQFNIFDVIKDFNKAKRIIQMSMTKVLLISLMPKSILQLYRNITDYNSKTLDAVKDEYYRRVQIGLHKNLRQGKSAATYCKNNNYKKVAVYGAFFLGRLLKDDLEYGGVSVCCYYDRAGGGSYFGIPCKNLDEFSEEIDAIIIAASYSSKEIKEDLSKKTNIPTVDIVEILNEMGYSTLELAKTE